MPDGALKDPYHLDIDKNSRCTPCKDTGGGRLALGKLGGPMAADALRKAFAEEKQNQVREEIEEALDMISKKRRGGRSAKAGTTDRAPTF